MDGQHLFVAACTFMPHTFSCIHHTLLCFVSLSDFSLGEYIHDKSKISLSLLEKVEKTSFTN